MGIVILNPSYLCCIDATRLHPAYGLRANNTCLAVVRTAYPTKKPPEGGSFTDAA